MIYDQTGEYFKYVTAFPTRTNYSLIVSCNVESSRKKDNIQTQFYAFFSSMQLIPKKIVGYARSLIRFNYFNDIYKNSFIDILRPVIIRLIKKLNGFINIPLNENNNI